MLSFQFQIFSLKFVQKKAKIRFLAFFTWLKSKSGLIYKKIETYVQILTSSWYARPQTGRTHTGSANRFQSFDFGNFLCPNCLNNFVFFHVLCVFWHPLSTLKASSKLVNFYYLLWIFMWKSLCPFFSKVVKKYKISSNELPLPTS